MSMSTSIRGQLHKSSFHGRHDSGELDVFEAARYFSAANDQSPGAGRYMNKQHQRRSLDMPCMMRSQFPPEYHHIMIMDHHHQNQNQNQNQAIENSKKNKKYKQPSSPGGRLASFLNSLFNQSHSKKKKKPIEDESTPGRRKRRSSISHFLSSSGDHKNANANANTPTKACKIMSTEQKNYKITLLDELHAERNGGAGDYAWLRMRNINGVSEYDQKKEEDEGADSDSSSDLFDLPNHDLDFLSSGLPLYGTTHMDRINANS